MPSDQRSTEKSCPLLRMISGATYSGVPQNVHVLRPCPIRFANPKSTCTQTHGSQCDNGQPRSLAVVYCISKHPKESYQFRISDRIEDHVFRFKVAVDDAAVVKIDQRLDSTRRVEPRRRVVKRVPALTTY